MKLLFDESLSPRLVELLRDLFPESESALQNGLAGAGDFRILEYASARNFVLVSTDRDFEGLNEAAWALLYPIELRRITKTPILRYRRLSIGTSRFRNRRGLKLPLSVSERITRWSGFRYGSRISAPIPH